MRLTVAKPIGDGVQNNWQDLEVVCSDDVLSNGCRGDRLQLGLGNTLCDAEHHDTGGKNGLGVKELERYVWVRSCVVLLNMTQCLLQMEFHPIRP